MLQWPALALDRAYLALLKHRFFFLRKPELSGVA